MDASELKRRFGLKVQELREAKHLTQEQLAALIGRSVDTISNIERGVNATRIETAYLLATRFEVPMHTLFDLEDAPDPAELDRHHDLQPILGLLHGLEADTLTRVKQLIEIGVELARRE